MLGLLQLDGWVCCMALVSAEVVSSSSSSSSRVACCERQPWFCCCCAVAAQRLWKSIVQGWFEQDEMQLQFER
jgi:hypothetical protein